MSGYSFISRVSIVFLALLAIAEAAIGDLIGALVSVGCCMFIVWGERQL